MENCQKALRNRLVHTWVHLRS